MGVDPETSADAADSASRTLHEAVAVVVVEVEENSRDPAHQSHR